MKEKLNGLIVGLVYLLALVGIVFLVLTFNNHDVIAYQDIYSGVTVGVFILVPVSIILSVIYFIKKRNRYNFITLVLSLVSISYIITYVFYIVFVVAKNLTS